MPKIEFFKYGRSLGIFDLPDISSESGRRNVALKNHVIGWTRYVLDDGKVEAVRHTNTTSIYIFADKIIIAEIDDNKWNPIAEYTRR